MSVPELHRAVDDLRTRAMRFEFHGTCAAQATDVQRLITSASRFVSAFDKAGGGHELHEQAVLFANLTGEDSRYANAVHFPRFADPGIGERIA